jgi:hypothetical protein
LRTSGILRRPVGACQSGSACALDSTNRFALWPTPGLNPNAFPVYRVRSDPSVDEPAVVANLESAAVDRIYDMKVFISADFAESDITNFKYRRVDRHHGASWPDSIRPVID